MNQLPHLSHTFPHEQGQVTWLRSSSFHDSVVADSSTQVMKNGREMKQLIQTLNGSFYQFEPNDENALYLYLSKI